MHMQHANANNTTVTGQRYVKTRDYINNQFVRSFVISLIDAIN